MNEKEAQAQGEKDQADYLSRLKTFELTVKIVEEGEDAKDAWENAREDLGRKVAGGTFDEAKDITPKAPKEAPKKDADNEDGAEMSNEEYVKEDGEKCPQCEGKNVEGDSIEVCGKYAYQGMGCNDCDCEWVAEYSLTGYTQH